MSQTAGGSLPEGLERRDDAAFLHVQDRLQRAGRWCLSLLLLAAIAGAFGDGLFSLGRANVSGLQVSFQRVARAQATNTFNLEFTEDSLLLLRTSLDAQQLEGVTPAPLSVMERGDWLVFRFASNRVSHAQFVLRPQRTGFLTITLAANPQARLEVRQWIFP
jgi:hypothetical protein